MTEIDGSRTPVRQEPSETALVAARVLNGLAAASLAVAFAAFAVMLTAWVASSDLAELREWPPGIAGWLVCVPALAASATFAIAAQWMRQSGGPES